MKQSVLILGTGKMARNIGIFFLVHGHAVTWYSEHEAHRVECGRSIAKAIRRMRPDDLQGDTSHAAFAGSSGALNGGPYLIVEATHELLDIKRKAFAAVRDLLTRPGTLILSTSSSLLPSDIHPDCIGCHFFYPVELTGVVELILPDSPPAVTAEAVRTLLAGLHLDAIEQNYMNAFAVNRLLLPLQNEVFRLLAEGYDPREIDAASISAYFPLGQCSFMDMVGLDTVRSSVVNYLSRVSAVQRAGYLHLIEGLCRVIAEEKFGRKNGDGLCIGKSLPWKRNGASLDERDRETLRHILRSTCDRFVAEGQLSEQSLLTALSSIFHADESVRLR